ncbi:MAG: hypothetical protein LBT88_02075 [Oscillospiraceae bacterium]|jgi:hypothetical protein|nr:hypothetical protein [Oscillospiraceae bacterium]
MTEQQLTFNDLLDKAFGEEFGSPEGTHTGTDDFESAFDTEVSAAAEQTTAPDKAEFTLKHLGEEVAVSRDKAIELAQKGMDYDRIRQRYDRLKTTALSSGGDAFAIKRMEDIDEFLEDFPNVNPEHIPDEVWRQVHAGKTLSDAYRRWEIAKLREEADDFAKILLGDE